MVLWWHTIAVKEITTRGSHEYMKDSDPTNQLFITNIWRHIHITLMLGLLYYSRDHSTGHAVWQSK